jgi:flagellar protein FlaF
MQRTASYFRTPQIGGATPRETEILAFGLCNDRLTRAATPRERIEALGKTQELWSLLVTDVGSEGNALPDDLKKNLIGLGFWAMQYATRAILKELPLQPLIDLHRDMIDGLRAQAAPPVPVPAEPWSERSSISA